jgi:hypothetical protein
MRVYEKSYVEGRDSPTPQLFDQQGGGDFKEGSQKDRGAAQDEEAT